MNYIFGASGFAKEVLWILVQKEVPKHMIKFVDHQPKEKTINGVEVIDEEQFFNAQGVKCCYIAVGNPILKEKIYNKICSFDGVLFPTLIAPSVKHYKEFNDYGIGNIICDGCIMTTNIKLGNFIHINLNSTIGHDTNIQDFCTISPGCNISGNVKIGKRSFFGTNCTILEELNICDDAIIGANAVVVKDITEAGTYIGIPAKKRS